MSDKSDKKKSTAVNPGGSGITKFVTDPKEEEWLEKNVIPKLHKSK